MITIFTDGAAQGNPGPGGYGVILRSGEHEKTLSEGFRLTTNNRMELLAVIRGLEALKKEGVPVVIYSDSKYVVDAVRQGWIWDWERKNFKKKANPDLWKQFIPLFKKYHPEFKWIKGHAGHPENEECDRLAVEAANTPPLQIDRWYEENQADD